MREIKFRAWEKKMKTMFIVDDITFEWRQVNTSTAFRYFDEVELMQCTGLKDRNGVEIYEGDVVSMIVFEDNAEYLGDVVFENGCFCLNISLDGTKYKVPAFEWKETETIITVIGNIHENKELLE